MQKKLFVVMTTLLIAIGLPASTYLVQRQQTYNSHAATPSQDLGPQVVKVLIMSYFPPDSSGNNLNFADTNYSSSLTDVRQKVNGLNSQLVVSLTEGSKYHGFKDTSAQASALIQVADTKEYLKPLPKSTFQAWGNPTVRPDYRKMLTEDVSICNYVDNLGVKQVWVWGYHNPNPGGIEPDESNMSMGLSSRSLWNHGIYGDVSNSQQIDDLPVCNSTYVLLNYSYSGGLGNALEDHGHQIERQMDFIDSDFWSSKFVKPHGLTDGTVNHCGWTHSPPNVTNNMQYHWSETISVPSDCADWKPDGGGAVVATSCHSWYGATCVDDGGSKFKVWWMQNIPGYNNQLTYQGKKLRNWWDFTTNFDAAMAAGKTFFMTTASPTVAPASPTPTTPVSPTPTSVVMSPTPTTPAVTPVVSPTWTPTPPIPTVSPLPNSTKFSLTLLLHGIGKGGDNANPSSTGNMSPLRPQRTVTLELIDNETGQNVRSVVGMVNYNSANGNFTGIIDGGPGIPSGQYFIKVKSPSYLRSAPQRTFTITQGQQQTVTIPTLTLVTADANNDNRLDILDYNYILDCYSELNPARDCTDPQKKTATDITDDGKVNQFDYNLFLREYSVQGGV